MASELDVLRELIELLKNLDIPIIVEGPRDQDALEAFDITNVHQLTRSLEAEAESIAKSNKGVVILTDLDAEGKRLYSSLKRLFTDLGVKVFDKPRELLFKTKLRQVEGLYRRFMRLQES